jgi:hypothetical protein
MRLMIDQSAPMMMMPQGLEMMEEPWKPHQHVHASTMTALKPKACG